MDANELTDCILASLSIGNNLPASDRALFTGYQVPGPHLAGLVSLKVTAVN
jgi:hypothetical protein